MSALTEGQILDDTYRLVRLVAEGGMGLVYEATHARLAGRYAIKVLPPKWSKDPEAMARFDREARIASSLQHPNIVQVIDFNTAADGTEYLVMEYLRGETLAARLTRLGPMSLDTVVAIIEQVASGLAAAHAHGIVHRDLKPENLLLMQVEGREGEWAKILDFGISKVADASLGTIDPVNSSLIGTPQYMAPEQCEGRTKEVNAATDQFALAAIAYEMLTARRPFAGESVGEVLFRVLHAEPPPMNIDDRAVESVVRRGLSKSSRHRYPSVTAFAEALRAAALVRAHRPMEERLEQSGSHGYAVGELDRMRLNVKRPSRRSPWAAALVAAAAVTVGTAFVVPTARTRARSPDTAPAAFASSERVAPSPTPVLAHRPSPSPVPEPAPRDESAMSLVERGAPAPSNLPDDAMIVARRAGEVKAAPVPIPTASATASAARARTAVARTAVARRPPTAARASAARPTRPTWPTTTTTERASAPPRPPNEQLRPPEPPPFKPLPTDEDAILPLDDTFNGRP